MPVDRDALVFRHFLLSLLNSCSMLLLGQCTTVAPEGHSASNLCARPNKGPTWHFLFTSIFQLKGTALCFFLFFLDQATNDWWTTWWNADQNSPQVHRWGKILKWLHLNKTLMGTVVSPGCSTLSQKWLSHYWLKSCIVISQCNTAIL